MAAVRLALVVAAALIAVLAVEPTAAVAQPGGRGGPAVVSPPPGPQVLPPRPPTPPAPPLRPPAVEAPALDEAGEVLVLTETAAAAQAAVEIAEALGFETLRSWPLDGLGAILGVFAPPPASDPAAAAAILRAALPGAVVDVNADYRQAAEPRLFAHSAIGWPTAGCLGTSPARLGLVDTGVAASHAALADAAIVERGFLVPGERPASFDHGTAIAALLAGASGAGPFAGLLPGAELFAANVFRHAANGAAASVEAIARAIDWLAGEAVRVVNMSLTGPRNLVLSAVVTKAVEHAMVVVAAAGNGGPGAPPAYPAAEAGVIAVTAVDARLRPFARANRGDYIDFAAPGVDLWVAQANGRGGYRSGTSFAVPFVVAIAAGHLGAWPQLGHRDLADLLQRSALDLGPAARDPQTGWGLARAPAACAGPP